MEPPPTTCHRVPLTLLCHMEQPCRPCDCDPPSHLTLSPACAEPSPCHVFLTQSCRCVSLNHLHSCVTESPPPTSSHAKTLASCNLTVPPPRIWARPAHVPHHACRGPLLGSPARSFRPSRAAARPCPSSPPRQGLSPTAWSLSPTCGSLVAQLFVQQWYSVAAHLALGWCSGACAGTREALFPNSLTGTAAPHSPPPACTALVSSTLTDVCGHRHIHLWDVPMPPEGSPRACS